MTCENCVHVHVMPDNSIICKMHKEKFKTAGTVLVCTCKEVEKPWK
jgi:hypothetical protein